MSEDTEAQKREDEKIDSAKSEFTQFTKALEEKYGYGIGATSHPTITPQGFIKVETVMQLVKVPPVVAQVSQSPVDEVVAQPAVEEATTTTNAEDTNTTPKETGTGDNKEQPAG